MTLEQFNLADEASVLSALLRCCGSKKWANRMLSGRPFSDRKTLLAQADSVWWELEAGDWREAFAAHPQIGEKKTSGWSSQEQSGMDAATVQLLERLAKGNEEYAKRFGWIFLINASGKTADEMLASLESRMRHESGEELRIAAGEQAQITKLRLNKLLSGISTHVLDTANGRPAAGIKVQLFLSDGLVSSGLTDGDGRVRSLLAEDVTLQSGTYRIVFDIGEYFPQSFYPEVSISFLVRENGLHYHVPLLISPFGYTTYRGS